MKASRGPEAGAGARSIFALTAAAAFLVSFDATMVATALLTLRIETRPGRTPREQF
jgi:hypothetical protein